MTIHISYTYKEYLCLENCRIGETDFKEGDSFIYYLDEKPVKELEILLETLVSEKIIVDISQ